MSYSVWYCPHVPMIGLGFSKLKHEEAGAWRSAARRMERAWQHIFNASQGHATNNEWIGIYANE
jgi:hypothetical protein